MEQRSELWSMKNYSREIERKELLPLEVMDLQYLLLQDTALSQGLVLVAHKIRTT